MRDVLVFLFVMMLLPTSFKRPFVGLLLFSWLAYMRPQDLCWGFARTMRLSFFVGVAMIAGWWAHERGKRAFATWDFRSRTILAFGFLITLSYAFAFTHDEYTNRYFFEFLKILAVALFTSGQVDTPQRFRVMAWTIALCLAFFGIKGGLFGLLHGGRPILRGPGGMMEDNNDFALALVMNVPLLWYLGLSERDRPWVKRVTQVAVLLTVITIVLTHSRGAFLALSASALWIAWRSGQLVRAVGVLLLLGLVFPLVAPHEVLERLASIGDTKESSAAARLNAWGIAFRMISDNPLLGVGMRNFHTEYPHYSVLPVGEGQQTYVAHNSYLQIWAESGSVAFVVYLVLLGSMFVVCRKVYHIGRSRPDMQWAADYARMMEATTIGFMVGAFFLNRGHFDLIYHWFSLATALGTVTFVAWRTKLTPAGAPAATRNGVTVRWRGPPLQLAGNTGAVWEGPRAPRWQRRS